MNHTVTIGAFTLVLAAVLLGGCETVPRGVSGTGIDVSTSTEGKRPLPVNPKTVIERPSGVQITQASRATKPSTGSFAITQPDDGDSLGRKVAVRGSSGGLAAGQEILLIVHPLESEKVWVQDPVRQSGNGFVGDVYLGETDQDTDQWYEVFAAKVPVGTYRVIRGGLSKRKLAEMSLSKNSILVYRAH